MVVPGLEIEISRGQSSMVINVLDVREDRRPAVEAQLYTKKLQNQLRSEKLNVISLDILVQGFSQRTIAQIKKKGVR